MKLLAIIVELIGIIVIGIGIGIEVTLGAEIGYISISVGSVFVATGGIIWGKFLRRK